MKTFSSQDTDMRSLPADVDFSNPLNLYTFVSMALPENIAGDGPGEPAATNYKAGTRAYGVLQNLAAPTSAGKLCESVCAIRVRNITPVRCGTAWKMGDTIGAGEGGLGQPATGDQARGIAWTDAAVGDVASVDLF